MSFPAVAGGFRRPSVRSRAQSKLQKAALETLESRKYLSAPWVADIQQTAGAYEGELTQLSMMLLDDDNPTDSDPIKTVGITWGDGTSDTFEFDTDFFSDSMFGHSYDDNAGPSTYPYHHIVITATDKQDEEVTFEHDLMVLNVNPWGSISNNGPANEGTPVTITANVSDSVGDTQAGLRYSFATSSGALATTYALAGTSAAGQLTFNENGTHTAYARAFDHDGGFSNFTTSVTVVNAAPVATLDVGDPALDGSVQVSFIEASDPSPTDTSTGLHYAFATDFNSLPTSYSAAGTATSHTYSTSEWNSSTTFWGRIFDRDNGYRTYSTSDVAPVSAAVASSSQINLTWTDEVENELGWRVQWSTDGANFDGYVNLSAGTDHFEATGLTEDTRYWFRVRAYDDATHPGATVYSPKVAQTTFLAAPTRVIAKADPGTGSGTITWKDNSGSEAEYVVLESSDGQTFDEIGSVSSDETSFDLTDLPESSQLIYRIRARKTGNTGDSILTPLVTLGENDLQVEDDFPKFEFSGVSGVKQRLVVKFNEDINGSLQSGDIHLDNLNTDQAVTITDSDWTYNSTTKTLTITFADEVNDPGSVGGPITGALADGNYQLRILAGDIAAAGVPLTNDIDHEFFFLNGDADHNRIVDVLDLVILNDNWFGTGKTFSQGDFNYDGAVNQWDLGIMSLKWQGTMPLPGVFNVFSSGPNQINLTWDDIAVGETGWRVQWSDDGTTFNTEDYINRPANSTHWEDETVPDGHRRWYRVRAYGTPNTPSDTIYSAKKGATTTILPPTAFTVAEAHADSIVLEWTPQSVYETGFLVQKSTDGVNYDQGAELGPGVTWYEVTDLDPETDYYFKITVHGEDADSMAVTSLSIRTQPAAPTLTSLDVNEAVLHPDAGGYASGELYFTPLTLTSGNGLVLERSVNGGDFVQLTPFDPINHQSGQIALWYYDIEGMSCAFRMYITDGSERISDYSNVLECTVAPNYPGYMSVNGDPTTSSVQLQWWDGSSHEDGYEVLVTPADGSEAWTISLAANTAGYTVTGLDEASAYDFKVRAVSSAGQSPWVADAIYGEVPHAIPVIATTKLAAPGGLDAAAANAVEVNLTWIDNSAFEDGSIIEYWATSGTGAHGLAYAPVNATGFPIMGLTPGTGYTFQVSAWRNNFAGGAGFVQSTVATDTATTSAVGSSTPPEDPPPPPVAEIDTHLYRWVFKGQVYSGYLHSSGQLQFTGSTSWTATPQPSALTAAIVEEYVSGSVTTIDPFPGDNIFDDPASHVYSFPADAGTTASDPFLITINSSTSATITFEDSIAWNYDTTHQEGTWTLNREDMLVGGDDPNSTSPPPAPAPGEVPLPYVYITATDPSGSESPDSGQSTPGPITFRVGRWQRDMTSSLVVNLFNPAGTATSGDYTGMPGSVTIDANQSYEEFTITPVDDDVFEEAESVFAILQASDTYWLTTAFMAEGQIADNDPDLDIDSDNNNAFDVPGRTPREERMEDDGAKPGKLIAANVDDSDGDGIPDFADGYNLAGGTTNAATTGEQFVPVIIQLPPGIAPANATLKLTYDASDPLDSDILLPAQSESGNYEIADGLLRLWSKPGNQLRDGHSIAAVSNAGHFIPSDTSFAATKLTWGTNNTATIWLEAVQASELFADGRINLSVSVQGESGVVRGDGVNTAEFSFQLDEVMDNGDLVPAGKIELSQPAPIVDVSTYQLSDAHISANNQHLLGDIELVGTVQSSFLDLVEGSTGAIDHLLVYLNDASEPISVSLSVSKASQRSTSLLAPFPFQGSFSFTLDDLTLSPGWNSVTLAARDPITGAVGQTSTAFELLVTPPTTTVPPVDYTGSTLAVGQTAPPKATGGGNLTRYAIEIMGPAGMENAGQISFGQQNRSIGRLGDGRAFVNAHNIPAGQAVPAVTAFLAKVQAGHIPFAIAPGEIPAYLVGVAAGFAQGGVSLVEGTWELANIANWIATGVDINVFVNLITGTKLKTAKQSAVEMAQGVKALAELFLKLNLQGSDEGKAAFRALITGDTEALEDISTIWSQRLSWAAEVLLELAAKIDALPAYDKGQVAGRAMFEILMVAIPGDELAQMTKLGYIEKLQTRKFFQSGKGLEAMNALGAARGNTKLGRLKKTMERMAAKGWEDEHVASMIVKMGDDFPNLTPLERYELVQNLPGLKSDVALQKGLNAVFEEYYEIATPGGIVTDEALAQLPTVKQVKQIVKPGYMENHHTIPEHVQELLRIPKIDPADATHILWDDCPSYVLNRIEHRLGQPGAPSFHQILVNYIPNNTVVNQIPDAELVRGLRFAYRDFEGKANGPVWLVVKKWLATKGFHE